MKDYFASTEISQYSPARFLISLYLHIRTSSTAHAHFASLKALTASSSIACITRTNFYRYVCGLSILLARALPLQNRIAHPRPPTPRWTGSSDPGLSRPRLPSYPDHFECYTTGVGHNSYLLLSEGWGSGNSNDLEDTQIHYTELGFLEWRLHVQE